ncbi:hypothetical protein MCAP1_002311 [Malassezia caprae]|uniref:[Histone H3]-trimethyl-L-lysine(9) demethylase n=1 Tax=Malassezia caprae TaxID=1381934 RepID=A0AAF0E5Q0_9BASI|nr:hypothetical protein MCAP1_002311 [Malassezia caprae]
MRGATALTPCLTMVAWPAPPGDQGDVKQPHLRDLRPSYLYPRSSGLAAPQRLGDAAEGPVRLDGVPVFEPTMEQFADFYAFCQAIDAWGMQSGIVKIVPPKEWVEALPSLRPEDDAPPTHASLAHVRIKHAITQHFLPAGPGKWTQTNVTRSKPLDAKQWSEMCQSPAQRGPAMSRIQRQVAAAAAAEAAEVHSRQYEASPAPNLATGGKLTRSGGVGLSAARPARGTTWKSTSREEWRTFDYEHQWLQEALTDAEREAGHTLSARDWDEPTCRAIETEYWRTLNLGQPPMYGADQQGTLFDARTSHWNVGELDSLLSRTLRCALPGVTTPYLYFGMWRASFAWHVEDMDLHSINYIHFGAPKQWYAIRQADRQRFESVMAAAFPVDARKCPQFLRHKSFLVSPSFLKSQGIRPLKLVQHAHEFVITYPYGYHAGFNLGYNCAESVNFALPSWIELGRIADYCRCPLAQESVHFDVDKFWPRRPAEAEPAGEAKSDGSTDTRATEAKSRARAPAPRAAPASVPARRVCVFCPNDTSDPLVPIPPEAVPALSRIPAARAALEECVRPPRAHQLCACFLPETWVAPGPPAAVQGAEHIHRARWALKCQVCAAPGAKHGAKIQCTKGKCPRAAHVSCALQEHSGWFVDICAPDVADKLEGTRSAAGSDERAVVLCRTHNPLLRVQAAEERDEALRQKVLALPRPSEVRVKTHGMIWTTQLWDVDEAQRLLVIESSGRDPAAPRVTVPWTQLVNGVCTVPWIL